jgi:ABC-type transport system involved in multi-copper enzyme maturation permease subunit
MTTTLAPRAGRVTQFGVIRSELTKMWSLRSTLAALITTAAVVVVPGLLLCAMRAANWPPRNPADALGFDPAAVSLTGVYLAQLALGVLGALVVTGEYATGTIRATLTAVPGRLPVLWGKVAAVILAGLAVTLPSVLAAFLGGQSFLAPQHIQTSLSAPGVTRAIIGSALFLTAVGLLGLGLGALLRSTAAAVSALVGLLFLVPILVGMIPGSAGATIGKYLPYAAGTAVTNVQPADPHFTLAPWTGLGVFCLYVLVSLGLAAWRLRSRDA